MILDDILTYKRQEVEKAKRKLPLDELQRRVKGRTAQRDFREALTESAKRPALIAELKRRSPSKGMLRDRFDPVRLGQELQDAGAAALSVLTDEKFFGGHLEFLRDVQQFTEIPLLRKDFLIDPYQIYESLYYQADAVLLIVQALTDGQLKAFLRLAYELGLDALVEVHTEPELVRAISAGAQIIGINSRDLRTFAMNPKVIEQLVPKIPAGKVIVAESGLHDAQDLTRLKALKVHAVLIGEALMLAGNPATKVKELFAEVW